jgi:pyruvate/2-oxoglutarate dehydrogenase complex dihydrolipoamide acyltransferase (E2) component
VAPAPPPRPATNGEGRRYSPLVKRIAAEHGIDLSGLSGSGRGGRVTKKDVLAAVESGPAKQPLLHSDSPYRPDPPAEQAQAPARNALAEGLGGVAEPLSRIRQSIGAAMLDSQRTAATCHTIVECDMTRVEARRRELGLTALPLVARATIETLREFPQLNATLDGTTITRFERVHLGIAVSLGEAGLMVPVVHDAHELSAEGLGTRIKDLARRARAKELGADDVRGASFTITNPGQFGALLATPVINQPQVGILDLEAVVKRPVVVSGPDGEDLIAIRPMVNLILGWDHRAMDGVYAASFLSALRAKLEAL